MPAADWAFTLEFDTDRDGSWTADESSRMIEAKITRGRENALQMIRPGKMVLTMKNNDGRFSPYNGAIANLDQFTPVRLYETWTTPQVLNIDDNPHLGVNANGWSAATDISGTRVTTERRYAGASYEVEKTGANAANGVVTRKRFSGNRFGVIAGNDYIASIFELSNAGAGQADPRIRLRWFTAVTGGSFISDDLSPPLRKGAGNWQRWFFSATAPTGALGCEVDIELLGNVSVGVKAHLDGHNFEQSATLNPYVDGNQPAAVWTASVDQSQSSRVANPTFLLFQGFLFDFDLKETKADSTAILICFDRLAMMKGVSISVRLFQQKKTGLMVNRLLDLLEGERCSNPSFEWTGAPAATNPLTGWAATAGASQSAHSMPITGSEEEFLEGDWSLEANPSGAGSAEGTVFTATADVDSLGKWRFSAYLQAVAGNQAVLMRFKIDGVNKGLTAFNLIGTDWVYQVFDFDITDLGTTRTIEFLTAFADADDFRIGALHIVKTSEAIDRDVDVGSQTITALAGYQEPGLPILQDVIKSEPGLLWVEAKRIADGDRVLFRDTVSRPFSTVEKAVFGDGKQLLGFAASPGIAFKLDANDRITDVEITSRGTPVLGTSEVTLWGSEREKNLALDDEFSVRYEAMTRRQLSFGLKGGVTIEHENKSYGEGHDIKITTASATAVLNLIGYQYEFVNEESRIVKSVAGDYRRALRVRMPLQDSNSVAMSQEAQRLLDKYKNRVIRTRLPLKFWAGADLAGQEDEVRSYQNELDVNDLIRVRADIRADSPGFDKRFWVEGIEHTIGRGHVHETVVKLEEE